MLLLPLSWLTSAALAAPLPFDAATYETTATACELGDSDACLELLSANTRAFAASQWLADGSLGEPDERRYWAMRQLRALACEAGTPELCASLLGSLAPRIPELVPPCLGELDCPAPQQPKVVPLEGESFAPLPAGGWVELSEGRLWPWDSEHGAVVIGAQRIEAVADGFVVLPQRTATTSPRHFAHLGPTGDRAVLIKAPRDQQICEFLDVGEHNLLVRAATDCRDLRKHYARVDIATGAWHPLTVSHHRLAHGWLVLVDGTHITRVHIDSQRSERSDTQAYRVTSARISIGPDGQVTYPQRSSTGEHSLWIWADEHLELPVAWGPVDWSEQGDIFVAPSDNLVHLSPQGEVLQTWALPGRHEELQVHPDGRSVVVDGELVILEGELSPQRPDWLGREDLRLPPQQVHGETVSVRLLQGELPVVGARVEGQYTDDEGRFLLARDRYAPNRVFVDGAYRRMSLAEDGTYQLEPATLVHHPEVVSTLSDALLTRPVGTSMGDRSLVYDELLLRAEAGDQDYLARSTDEPLEWTARQALSLQVVDEAGVPVASLPLRWTDPRWDLSQTVTSDIHGRVLLYDPDIVTLSPLMARGSTLELSVEGDLIQVTDSAPGPSLEPGPPVASAGELFGTWQLQVPTGGAEIITFTPWTIGDGALVANTLHTADGRTLHIADRDHVVSTGGPEDPLVAPLRRVESPSSPGGRRWLTPQFDWQAGDQAVVTTRTARARHVETLTVEQAGEQLVIRRSLEGFEGPALPANARTILVAPTGRFVGMPDAQGDLDGVVEELYETIGQAAGLVSLLDAEEWEVKAAGDWFTTLGFLVGRQYRRGEVVEELVRRPDGSLWDTTTSYKGRVSCGELRRRCARVRVQATQRTARGSSEQVTIELVFDPRTLKPYRIKRSEQRHTTVQTWDWSP